MNPSSLRALLAAVRSGSTSVEHALQQLRALPYADLGFARVDRHRALRHGAPEAIFCEGKTRAHIVKIAAKLLADKVPVLATRADAATARALKGMSRRAVYHPTARVVVIPSTPRRRLRGDVLIVTAGTADIPVAEEAKVTAMTLGSAVDTRFDVGVAGVHRLFDQLDRLRRARVIIVAAGMDGVLPSVVGGLVSTPVIAVPTSRGYGAHFGGLAPLLTMLNACSGGIGVVNIDNGFGAGHLAHRINLPDDADQVSSSDSDA